MCGEEKEGTVEPQPALAATSWSMTLSCGTDQQFLYKFLLFVIFHVQDHALRAALAVIDDQSWTIVKYK